MDGWTDGWMDTLYIVCTFVYILYVLMWKMYVLMYFCIYSDTDKYSVFWYCNKTLPVSKLKIKPNKMFFFLST